MATRNGSAEWRGDIQGGAGTVTVGDGVLEGKYSFESRFGEGESPLTNPEQLIAAAHAACFSMALAGAIGAEGHAPESISTTARVQLRNVDGAPTLTRIDLDTTGRVPGVDDASFQRLAAQAKAACPVSRALAAVPEIALTATLEGGG
jgi:osmotically inducible protein OsmC